MVEMDRRILALKSTEENKSHHIYRMIRAMIDFVGMKEKRWRLSRFISRHAPQQVIGTGLLYPEDPPLTK